MSSGDTKIMDKKACLTTRDISIIERITKCEDNDRTFPEKMELCFKNLTEKIDTLIKSNDMRLLSLENRLTKFETDLKIYNSNQGRDIQVMADKLETKLKEHKNSVDDSLIDYENRNDKKIDEIFKVNFEQEKRIDRIYWTVGIAFTIISFLIPFIIWVINRFTDLQI